MKDFNILAEKSIDAFGNIHILCNNAGVAPPAVDEPIWDHEQNAWDWVMGVNFYGVLYGLQSFVPHMPWKDKGQGVNFSCKIFLQAIAYSSLMAMLFFPDLVK